MSYFSVMFVEYSTPSFVFLCSGMLLKSGLRIRSIFGRNPDPANQNFKIGSRILLALNESIQTSTFFSHQTYFFWYLNDWLFLSEKSVFRIRIHFLRIRIQDFFPNPDPGSRIRILNPDPGNKHLFFQSKSKIYVEIFVFNPKVPTYFIFVFNQSSRYPILLNRGLLFGIIFIYT